MRGTRSGGSGQREGSRVPRDLLRTKTPHEEEPIQRQIAATDKHIDALVCEPHGLTEDEIGIAGEDKERRNKRCGKATWHFTRQGHARENRKTESWGFEGSLEW